MITLYKDAAYHDTFTFGTFAPYAREQKKLIAYSQGLLSIVLNTFF